MNGHRQSTTDRNRLTLPEMRRRDWRILGESLPDLDECDELRRALTLLAWGDGWKGGRPYGNCLRRVWKGLAGGSLQVGVFRVERSGRWGIAFALDPHYAAERAARRRRRPAIGGGLDAAFEADFQRRSKARLSVQ